MADEGIFIATAELVAPLVERMLRLLQHLLIDEENDELLEEMIAAVSVAYDATGEIAFGNVDTDEPWRALLDPVVARLEWLPYAAQLTGGVMPPRVSGETDDAYLDRARLELTYPRGLYRSSRSSAEIVAAPFLSGTERFVLTYDKDDPRIVYVDIIDSEVADPVGLLAALNHPDVVYAGERFEFVPTEEITWNDITTGHAWNAAAITWEASANTEP